MTTKELDKWEIRFEEYDGYYMFGVFKNNKFMRDFSNRQAAETYVDMNKYDYHVLYDKYIDSYDIYEDLKYCGCGDFFHDVENMLDGEKFIIYEHGSPFDVYIGKMDGIKRIRPKADYLDTPVKPVDDIPAGPGYDPQDEHDVDEKQYNLDMVNNPPHYNDHPSGIECIDVVRWFNFNIGNVIKYLWRAGLKDKDKIIEDLEKAKFYLQDEIDRLKGLHDV